MALTDAATTGGLPPVLDAAARRTAFVLPAVRAAVGEARHRVQQQLQEWSIASDICDTAVLVVSELFTNGVIHTGSRTITCDLGATPNQLLIQVTDDGTGQSTPSPRRARPQDVEGRGLMLVRAVSQRWGASPTGAGGGQVVWATLPLAQA
ncbi:ATP-binding protein [Streptomyces sp. NPDC058469]|uniref:ATP-binding protein n=1 Tax=Streptomyces sp. NPDC058469 TaxID=3346514 RepID=UPI00366210C2